MDRNKIDMYLTDIFWVIVTSPIWITLCIGAYSVLSILYMSIFN
jgi:hypothetical protein